MKKKILITGGTGFIGKNLLEHLFDEYDCIAPSRKELNLLDDAMVETYLRSYQFDYIIHSAIHNSRQRPDNDPNQELYINLRMFFTLARCKNLYKRMFYFGSGAEYHRKYMPSKVQETFFNTKMPEDNYGFSKYIMALQALSTDNIYNLILFGCFGKYEDWWSRYISQTICRVLVGQDIIIHQNVIFDYIYINDVAGIIKKLLGKKTLQYKQYNVCTGNPTDLVAIAKRVLSVMKVKRKIIVEHGGFKREYTGDNSRLMSEIGNYTFTRMDSAITDLVSWYSSNRIVIDPKKFI